MRWLYTFRVSPCGKIVSESNLTDRPDAWEILKNEFDFKTVPVGGMYLLDTVVYVELEVDE